MVLRSNLVIFVLALNFQGKGLFNNSIFKILSNSFEFSNSSQLFIAKTSRIRTPNRRNIFQVSSF